jgi:hypothetical protein
MVKIAKYIIGAWFMTGASVAWAGDVPQDVADSMMRSCRADFHRICPDVVPGAGRAAACLLDHQAELSPPCLEGVKTAHAIEVCTPDYRRYCDGAKGRQAMECLAGRMQELQQECRRIVAANAPYMNRDSSRYAYGGSAPYGSPGQDPYAYRGGPEDEDNYAGEGGPSASYGAYPYPGRPGFGGYPYAGPPAPGGAYPYSGRPGPYGAYPYGGSPAPDRGYAYSDRPGPDSAYGYPGRPAPGGAYPDAGRSGPAPEERDTGEDRQRFRSYDERYAGPIGPRRDYDRGAPGGRETQGEERE